MENPRNGLLPERRVVAGLSYTDADYCRYADWGYQKPTRFWGSPEVTALTLKLCDGRTCPNLKQPLTTTKGTQRAKHLMTLSSPHQNLSRNLKYRIPPSLILILGGFTLSPTVIPTRMLRLTETYPEGEERSCDHERQLLITVR